MVVERFETFFFSIQLFTYHEKQHSLTQIKKKYVSLIMMIVVPKLTWSIAVFPMLAAWCIGIRRVLSKTVVVTPILSSSSTMAVNSPITAWCRGVRPRLSLAFISSVPCSTGKAVGRGSGAEGKGSMIVQVHLLIIHSSTIYYCTTSVWQHVKL